MLNSLRQLFGNYDSPADEQEFLISPFVKYSKHYTGRNTDGCSFYDIELENQELEEIEPQELKKLMTAAVDGFEKFMETLKEEKELDDKARLYFNGMQRYHGEDFEYAHEKYNEFSRKASDKRNQNNVYRDLITKLVRGSCKAKELEINEARNVLQENIAKVASEHQARVMQEISKEANNNLHQKYNNLIADLNTVKVTLFNSRNSILEIEKKAKQTSTNLGTHFNDDVYRAQITQKFADILEHIEKIIETFNSSNSFSNKETADAERELSNLDRIVEPINSIKTRFSDLSRNGTQYRKESENNVKENLYNKIFMTLKSARLQNYYNQMQVLQARKPSIFDRITGKAALREEQMRQLELKIQFENSTKPKKQSKYSIHDMLADLYYTSDVELNGNATPEMQDLIGRINAQYNESYITSSGQVMTRSFSRNDLVAKKANEKAQSDELALSVQHNRIRGFFATRRAVADIRAKNNQLAQRVSQIKQQNMREEHRDDNNAFYNQSFNVQSNSLNEFSGILDTISDSLKIIESEFGQPKGVPVNEKTQAEGTIPNKDDTSPIFTI